jgi:hypothetical protein
MVLTRVLMLRRKGVEAMHLGVDHILMYER